MILSKTEIASLSKLTRDEVLKLPDEEKMKYFYAVRVKHANLETIGSLLVRRLSPYNSSNLHFLIGSTYVGKTTLVQRLMRKKVEAMYVNQNLSADVVPFIYISVPANGDKSISWTAIYENIMREGREILISKKQQTIINDGFMSVQRTNFRSLAALRQALESMLEHRKVEVIVLDEAYHLLRFGKYSALMDTIKSLSDGKGIQLILVGSYNLVELATNYGQAASRSSILHFERYRRDNDLDRQEFARVVSKVELYWPCEEVPYFSGVWEELLEVSLGCTGIFMQALQDALSLQLNNKGKWEPRFLAFASKSRKLLETIRCEIEEGERQINDAVYGNSYFSSKEMLEKIEDKMVRKG